MDVVLDFERPIVELRRRIEQLRDLQQQNGVDLSASIEQLEHQAKRLQQTIFGKLTPWQRTQLARHPGRPYMLDYVEALFAEWTELHGDRAGYDDHAMLCGTARFKPGSVNSLSGGDVSSGGDGLDHQSVMLIGSQKGRNTKENLFRNFGMVRPDGYRKALRAMKLADRFGLPIITFIDTSGAYPGVDAEERGQAEAIARNIMEMARLRVPVVSIVIGEGGSGGALAIGVANRVLMLENSVYSVISPEGCAAILWRDRAEGARAAAALRITAADCLELGVIDEVIPEHLGSAHRFPAPTIESVGAVIRKHLAELMPLSRQDIDSDRYDRFRKLGAFREMPRP